MSDLAVKRQRAWEAFIQKRSETVRQYDELVRKESNSPYAPMREYLATLPKTVQEIIPSFFLPMEEYLEFPEQSEQEVQRYNEIVARVNAITEQMLEEAEREIEAYNANVV